MSSSNMPKAPDAFAPSHRSHSDDEPLPSRAPFDYSAQSMQKVKLPASEEGDAQFRRPGGNNEHNASMASTTRETGHGPSKPVHVNCDCERTKSGNHEGHCMSKLHGMDPFVNEPVGAIKAPEGHHFFKDGKVPEPVPESQRETVEWFGKPRD